MKVSRPESTADTGLDDPVSGELRAILDTVQDGIVTIDAVGTIETANPAMAGLFGYQAVELVGQNVNILIPATYRATHDTRLRAFSGDDGVTIVRSRQVEGLRKDGTVFPLNLTVTATRIGGRRRFVGVMRDISLERLAEQALRASEQHYRLLVEQAADGIFMLDSEARRVIEANDAGCQMFGFGREGMIGAAVADLLAAEEIVRIRSALRRIEGNPVLRGEWLLRRRDGSYFPGESSVRQLPDGSVQVMLRDISERRTAEEAQRIAAVAFESREGMMVTDTRGRILRVNRAFSEVTGYSADEAIGKTPALLKSGRQDDAFYRQMWEAIRREGRWAGEVWNRRKDGGIYPEWLQITAICDDAGQTTHYLAVFSDVSEPKQAERKILELAFYDALTNLPNRRLLMDRLQQAMIGSARSGQYGALLLLDLDHFKTLNDTRGHDVGDELLIEVGRRLRETLREADTAARLGGDEFVVLLEDLGIDEVGAAAAAETIAEKLRLSLTQEYLLKGEFHRITPSIGVTLYRYHEQDAAALLKQADLALYQAKDAGRDSIRFFNPEMQAAIDARVQTEAGLRRALAEGQFSLLYQAQVDERGRVTGAEALLRWQVPGKDPARPAAFIPVAEDTGLILPIGRWVLETACRQLVTWSAVAATRQLTLAVNISARQFRQPDFVADVRRVLASTGADPRSLKLELTESLVVEDIDQVIRIMRALKAIGVGFAMDDFGTGYSSLANLKRLPLDQLKIDQRFVRDIPDDTEDCAIAQAVIAMGRSLKLDVIAEGVETQAQADFLADHGCRAFQGYLFGRPGPATAIEALARGEPAGNDAGAIAG